ncbi:MAG TPA: integration host factor subunit beta, partial [Desulfobacterales bacterium]|nr:integration host factor subunit beta [Desulfobacterales bacterium]
MNKSELIEALAAKTNLPVREVGGIVNTILETMAAALERG